jgi:hypothetical protein
MPFLGLSIMYIFLKSSDLMIFSRITLPMKPVVPEMKMVLFL